MSDIETNDEVTPDSLMAQFKGKGVVPILIFTLVVHFVLIIGSSVPYLAKSVFGADKSKLSEEERLKSAVEDATAALREIADDHGLNPQDISSQFGGGGSRTAKASASKEPVADEKKPAGDTKKDPEREKSEYEKKLETKADGPKMPGFEDDKDDIF
jgi:hypothetical protein